MSAGLEGWTRPEHLPVRVPWGWGGTTRQLHSQYVCWLVWVMTEPADTTLAGTVKSGDSPSEVSWGTPPPPRPSQLDSDPSLRENHKIYNPTLEYRCQDWTASVADAHTVKNTTSSSEPIEDVEYLFKRWKAEQVGQLYWPGLPVNAWVRRYTKVDLVAQWHLERLSQPCNKANNISELSRPLNQHLWSILPYSWVSKATSNDCLHPQVLTVIVWGRGMVGGENGEEETGFFIPTKFYHGK